MLQHSVVWTATRAGVGQLPDRQHYGEAITEAYQSRSPGRFRSIDRDRQCTAGRLPSPTIGVRSRARIAGDLDELGIDDGDTAVSGKLKRSENCATISVALRSWWRRVSRLPYEDGQNDPSSCR
jgi:hypothetical protein